MDRMHLVTGATGHLGNVVIQRLLAAGPCAIRALVVPGDPVAERLPEMVERHSGDLLDPASLDAFFSASAGTERMVVHCAGLVSTQSSYSQRLHDVNVGGTRNILDACMRHRVRKLVHVSSVHAMPVLPPGETMGEVERYDPAAVAGPYARTKAEASALVLEAASAGLDATIVCPSGIIGPFDFGKGHMTQLVIDFCSGRMPAIVPGGFDFVDVRDVAAGIVSALDHGRRGESYILGNRYFSVVELFDLLQAVTGRRRTRVVVPIRMAKAAAPLLGIYYRIRRQPPLFSAYSLMTLNVNACYSHDKAERELGYSTRPMLETLRDTVDWLRQEGRI